MPQNQFRSSMSHNRHLNIFTAHLPTKVGGGGEQGCLLMPYEAPPFFFFFVLRVRCTTTLLYIKNPPPNLKKEIFSRAREGWWERRVG